MPVGGLDTMRDLHRCRKVGVGADMRCEVAIEFHAITLRKSANPKCMP